MSLVSTSTFICTPMQSLKTEEKKDELKAIKEFMASGKDEFEAALKYFSSVDSVIIHDDHLTIIIERVDLEEEEIENNVYEIPYSFTYFEDILQVISTTNKELVIEHNPSINKGKRALRILTHKDLKVVTFSNYNILPESCYNFVKDVCQLEEAYLVFNGISQTTLEQFFSIPLSHYTIWTYMNLALFEDYNETTFPNVKNLTLLQYIYFSTESICCPADVYNYFDCLSKYFPNLENLEVYFDTALSPKDQWNFMSWFDVYSNLTEFKVDGFDNILSKVKGNITLYVYEKQECFGNVLEKVGEETKVEIDTDKQQLIRKFDIHDGLILKFCMQFNCKESKDNL